MDGLTTNGVLVMHPRGGFTEESKPGVWREISVCGDVYTLRETRSAQTRGKLISAQTHTDLYTHTGTNTHTHACTNTHARAHTNTYRHTDTYTQTHRHPHTDSSNKGL